MYKAVNKAQAVWLMLCMIMVPLLFGTGVNAAASLHPMQQPFSEGELDELFAPIALYPDPLLAQVIPASTFFDQLADAKRVLGGKSDDSLIANQTWDISVKSVAHYPQILDMMVQKPDWTTAIGQAYVNQSTDVGKSIQRLRAEAKAAGNLETSAQQTVTTEGQVIKIEPAQPQVIYVPQYNPQTVYVDSGPSTGATIAASAISFGVGMAMGAWLNNDYDYNGRGVYYHGWNGGGWVGANRNYANVNVNRNVYVNNRYNNVNVNRNVNSRNISNYRTDLNRNATVRQERVNNANVRQNTANRANARPAGERVSNTGERRDTNAANRRDGNTAERRDPNAAAGRDPNAAARRDTNAGGSANRASANRTEALNSRDRNREQLDSQRNRQTQPTRDANTAFGGGGNRSQVKQESNRGSQSVQAMNADRSSGGRSAGGGASRPSGGGASRPSGGASKPTPAAGGRGGGASKPSPPAGGRGNVSKPSPPAGGRKGRG